MLLAERLRSAEERIVVHAVLQRVLRVTLDLDAVYAADAAAAQETLSQRLAECADHEFAVRSLSSVPACVLCAPSFLLWLPGRKRCD